MFWPDELALREYLEAQHQLANHDDSGFRADHQRKVIWAQIALAIVRSSFRSSWPLSFLFWAMITYSLYAVIAGAVLRVFSAAGRFHHQ